jgi:hypothetical protein
MIIDDDSYIAKHELSIILGGVFYNALRVKSM